MIQIRTKSEPDTNAFAAALAEVFKAGDLLLLTGEMGAGKTTFTKGFAAALGILEHVTSPTFVLMHSYEGKLPLHHVDVYRLEHLQEVIDLGLFELLEDGGVAVIEWGEVAKPALGKDYLELVLAVDDDDDDVRNGTLNLSGSWTDREDVLEAAVSQWIQ